MRPAPIVSFEQRYGVAIALNLVSTALMLPRPSALAAVRRTSPLSPATLLLLALFGVVVDVALWYLVARQGSNVARWIVSAFVVVSMVSLLSSIALHRLPGGVVGILSAIIVLLEGAGVVALFRREAEPFFHGAVR